MTEQPTMATTASPMEGVVDETLETEEWVGEGEWAPDPNEPRYCLCNQVSYGDMVACDNPEVIPFSLPISLDQLMYLLFRFTVSSGVVPLRLR